MLLFGTFILALITYIKS
ncbi:putative holin-like toxin [Paenibacillus sp. DMB20]|nr:putative holin-like toxin [Paenibacillus sp. DMB20]